MTATTSDTRENIVVCCDGTWCGPETGTRSNIQILADAFASYKNKPLLVKDGKPEYNPTTRSYVAYFNGVGTGGLDRHATSPLPGLGPVGAGLDLLSYVINGVVAGDVELRCKEAYKFIVDNYNGPRASRIWLFGLSRGAYTVRAVAGMINNCGIINRAGLSPTKKDALVDKVWSIFKSQEDCCRPHGDTAEAFRREHSYPHDSNTLPPVFFMGLLDTVGAIGLPNIDPTAPVDERTLSYHYRFRDIVVSSEVQHVFQACSTQDRLTPFENCPIRRSWEKIGGTAQPGESCSDTQGTSDQGSQPSRDGYSQEEVWYPGAHYDLGRQDFVFSNQPVTNELNRLFNFFKVNVNCTPALADYPLVGYELEKGLGKKQSPGPSIVSSIYSFDERVLPPPQDDKAWKAYVKGIRQLTLRTMVAGVLSALPFTTKVVQLAGGLLPLPLFQPPYDIDAETKILWGVDELFSMAFGAERGNNILLKDRSIPLPGEKGYNIGKATFFTVPGQTEQDIYMPTYRPGWFCSRTYETYQARYTEAPTETAGSSGASGSRAGAGAALTERKQQKLVKPEAYNTSTS